MKKIGLVYRRHSDYILSSDLLIFYTSSDNKPSKAPTPCLHTLNISMCMHPNGVFMLKYNILSTPLCHGGKISPKKMQNEKMVQTTWN